MIKQILKEEGLQEERFNILNRMLMKKYRLPVDDLKILKGLPPEDQFELVELILDYDSFSDIEKWIRQRKSGNIS